MKALIAAAVLAVSCSSAFASSLKCLDVSNDYVLSGDEEAVMIRLKQDLCDSVEYSILVLRGDTLQPWMTQKFQIGKGMKDSPGVWDQKYELIMTPTQAQMTVKDLMDPNNCVKVGTVELSNRANLVGTMTTTCDNAAPVTTPIKLLRLR